MNMKLILSRGSLNFFCLKKNFGITYLSQRITVLSRLWPRELQCRLCLRLCLGLCLSSGFAQKSESTSPEISQAEQRLAQTASMPAGLAPGAVGYAANPLKLEESSLSSQSKSEASIAAGSAKVNQAGELVYTSGLVIEGKVEKPQVQFNMIKEAPPERSIVFKTSFRKRLLEWERDPNFNAAAKLRNDVENP